MEFNYERWHTIFTNTRVKLNKEKDSANSIKEKIEVRDIENEIKDVQEDISKNMFLQESKIGRKIRCVIAKSKDLISINNNYIFSLEAYTEGFIKLIEEASINIIFLERKLKEKDEIIEKLKREEDNGQL
jgi:hypothetical protein